MTKVAWCILYLWVRLEIAIEVLQVSIYKRRGTLLAIQGTIRTSSILLHPRRRFVSRCFWVVNGYTIDLTVGDGKGFIGLRM